MEIEFHELYKNLESKESNLVKYGYHWLPYWILNFLVFFSKIANCESNFLSHIEKVEPFPFLLKFDKGLKLILVSHLTTHYVKETKKFNIHILPSLTFLLFQILVSISS